MIVTLNYATVSQLVNSSFSAIDIPSEGIIL